MSLARRSIVTAQNVLAIAVVMRRTVIAVTHAVMRRVAVMHARMAPIMRMRRGAVVGQRAFPIDRIRCEIAGTAKGRALISIVILMYRLRVILLHRIRQPLIGPAAAATSAAARIDR